MATKRASLYITRSEKPAIISGESALYSHFDWSNVALSEKILTALNKLHHITLGLLYNGIKFKGKLVNYVIFGQGALLLRIEPSTITKVKEKKRADVKFMKEQSMRICGTEKVDLGDHFRSSSAI